MAPSAGASPGAQIEYDVVVRMRDGSELLGDLYRPVAASPAPTIVQRTPYGKAVVAHLNYSLDLLRAVRCGWNVLVQDVRGRGGSHGLFDPFRAEIDDGHDTLRWIAAQAWSDGNVVMAGGSYLGATQWLAAMSGPASLRALAPAFTPDDYYDGWVNDGGARRRGFLAHWVYESLWAGLSQRAGVPAADGEVQGELRDALAAPAHPGHGPHGRAAAPFLQAWSEHPTRDAYWTSVSPRERLASLSTPAFVIAGWFDLFSRGSIDSFVRMRESGNTPRVRRQMRLVVGPWTHGQFGGAYADADFGPGATAQAIDLTGLQLRWFESVVYGAADPAADEPAVRVFVMGANEWREFDHWPPPAAVTVAMRLGSEPPRLDAPVPVAAGFRGVASRPAQPVPTVGGGTFLAGRQVNLNAGPRDQMALDDRLDILRYETVALAEPLQIIGRVRARLAVSCDRGDVNVAVKLVCLPPGGRSLNLAEGVVRLSHRKSDEVPAPVAPGQICSVCVDLGHTAVALPAGSRLRLDIAASNFPHLADPDSDEHDLTATGNEVLSITVHAGGRHPSALLLDVVPAP